MHHLPPKVPSACSSMFSKSRLPSHNENKQQIPVTNQVMACWGMNHSALSRGLHGLCVCVCTCQGVDPILAGTVVSLGVALVKLTLENTQQARDPVVQSHIQDKLNSWKTQQKDHMSAIEKDVFLLFTDC